MVRLGLVALIPIVCMAAAHPEAASVLIIVNDSVAPQEATGGKSASVFVGEYYANKRGVPLSNIVHLATEPAWQCADPTAWDCFNTYWEKFDAQIRQPVKKFLTDHNLTNQINYIVPVYGVPLGAGDPTHTTGMSVDTALAVINSGVTGKMSNPYFAAWNVMKPHFREFTNPYPWKMYIVTRIDGPTVQIACGLVDKAIAAEAALKTSDGTAYFDYRNVNSSSGYYPADQTVVNANKIALSKGYQTVFNDQTITGSMIHSAPKTLWAWGWYSGQQTWEGYEFVPGAVGAQLTSFTALGVNTYQPGAWVPVWLRDGITATWGAVAEPTTAGYANGDNLLNKFWQGYNFGEAAYQAAPYLNHMMVFVGDPLYAPKVFQSVQPAPSCTLDTNADSKCSNSDVVNMVRKALGQ